MNKLLTVEVTENLLRGVVSQKRGREHLILDFFEEKLPAKESAGERNSYVADRLGKLRNDRLLSAYKTKVLYNTGSYHFFTIELPRLPEEEVEAVLRKKIEKEQEKLDGKRFVYEKLGYSREKNRDVYFVKTLEEGSIEGLKNKKLKVTGLDFEVYSLERLYSNFLEEGKNILFLDLRSDRTILMIYNQKSLELYRSINVGLEDLLKNISEFLGVDSVKAQEYKTRYGFIDKEMAEVMLENGEEFAPQLNLAYEIFLNKILRRILQSIDYFHSNNRGQEIDCIKFTGEYLRIANIGELLCDKTNIKKALPFRPLEGFKLKADVDLENCDVNTILGTLKTKRMPLSFRKKRRLPFKVNSLYISVLTFFLVLISLNFFYYKVKEYRLKKTEQRILSTLQPFFKKIDEYDKLQNEIEIMDKKIEKLEKRGTAGEFYRVLYDITESIPAEIYFNSLSFNGRSVSLKGLATSETGHQELYIKGVSDSLSKLYRVEVGEIKMLQNNPNAKSFDLEIFLSGGGK